MPAARGAQGAGTPRRRRDRLRRTARRRRFGAAAARALRATLAPRLPARARRAVGHDRRGRGAGGGARPSSAGLGAGRGARAPASLIGHGVEAAFPANVALGALALSRGGFYPRRWTRRMPATGAVDRILVTGFGQWRGEALALLERAA